MATCFKLPALNTATFAGYLHGEVTHLPAKRGIAVTFEVEVGRDERHFRVPCVAWGAVAEAVVRHASDRAVALLVTGSLSTRSASKALFVRVGALQFLDDPGELA